MTRLAKRITIGISIIIILGAGGIYFLYYFLSAFAPPKLIITPTYISTNHDFVNGVTIEKIRVDSIGNEGYPINYTTLYTTSCKIQHPTNKPPDPPSKIEFYKPGKYSWNEDTIKVKHIHNGLSRQSINTTNKPWWLNKYGDYPICPMKFEQEQWYFFSIGDPRLY